MTTSPIKEAWRSIYQMRTCPPFSVISSPGHSAIVAEHRKGCPLCTPRDAPSVDVEAWAALGRQMVGNRPKPRKPELHPGQIWSLVKTKGGWDQRFRYINPPLVLVLEIFEDVQGVRVAQVFDQHELASDGDVPLGDGLSFAEAWNTYPLDQADLDQCFGQVGVDTLHAVHEALETGQRDLEEESTVWFFRQLELEVGAFMAMEAMSRLMVRHERHALREALADAASVRNKVLSFDRSIILPDDPDGLRMLSLASLSVKRMAAATVKNQIPFNVVGVGQDTIPCRGALAEIKQPRLDGSTIRVTGTLPEDARRGFLFSWWRRPGMEMEEGTVKYDPASGLFRSDFFGKNEKDFKQGELILLFVTANNEDGQ